MKSHFFSSSSILKKFLVFNLIVFLFLGIFTFLYLSAIKPNLVKNRSEKHSKIINNTLDHIKRLNVEFTKESSTEFLLSTRFLFQNLDRVQLYDLNLNLLTDTDTLDLAEDIFIESQDIKETPMAFIVIANTPTLAPPLIMPHFKFLKSFLFLLLLYR